MRKPSTPTADERTALTRQDWLRAALAAFVESGVESVRVEPLAKRLGISKGSFYWHFKDRPDLLAGLLDFWEIECTGEVIGQIAHLPSPQSRLRALTQIALADKIGEVDNARAESAMQAWAARDSAVASRLRIVDARRIGYLAEELAALGFKPERANQLAKVIYQALLGLYSARAYNPDLADDSAYLALVELVLAETRWNR